MKEGATVADEDRDYEECRKIATSDPVIPALFGVFDAVGVFLGVNHKDSNIRSCMEGRGWNRNQAQTPNANSAFPRALQLIADKTSSSNVPFAAHSVPWPSAPLGKEARPPELNEIVSVRVTGSPPASAWI